MGYVLKVAAFAGALVWVTFTMGASIEVGRYLVLALCVLSVVLAIIDCWKLDRWPVVKRHVFAEPGVPGPHTRVIDDPQPWWQRTWLIKRRSDFESMPRFYGIAWHLHAAPAVIIAPVPFNMVLGIAFDLWSFMCYGWRYSCPTSPHRAYRAGIDEGRREGYELAMREKNLR